MMLRAAHYSACTTCENRKYLQRIIRGARYEAIPEPLVPWLPQDVAQLAVQVLKKNMITDKAATDGNRMS